MLCSSRPPNKLTATSSSYMTCSTTLLTLYQDIFNLFDKTVRSDWCGSNNVEYSFPMAKDNLRFHEPTGTCSSPGKPPCVPLSITATPSATQLIWNSQFRTVSECNLLVTFTFSVLFSATGWPCDRTHQMCCAPKPLTESSLYRAEKLQRQQPRKGGAKKSKFVNRRPILSGVFRTPTFTRQ